MFGSKKDRVFLGKRASRDISTGVFSTVTAPGLGKTSSMDRTVFEKAVRSANTVLREARANGSDIVNGRRR